MCGLAGIFAPGPSRPGEASAQLDRMLATLRARGPDGEGRYQSSLGWLGHRRLALHDPSGAGTMPFVRPALKLAWAVNGTIHNAHELVREHGIDSLRSRSDCEPLGALWRSLGASTFEALHGPFAIALFDEWAGKLILARDSAGEKPLFYAQVDGAIHFASTLAALMESVPTLTWNLPALRFYFRAGYVLAPETPFAEIRSLPAGHWLEADGQSVHIHAFSPKSSSPPETFESALDRALECRLRVERPIGVLLSGGLDSALILDRANRLAKAPLPTFTLGFPGTSFDEREAARTTARTLGSPHQALAFAGDPWMLTHALVRETGELLADSSWLALANLIEQTRGHMRVLLGGEGADELLLGYRRYRALAWSAWIPPGLARTAARLSPTAATRRFFLAAGAMSPAARYAELVALTPLALFHRFVRPTEPNFEDPLSERFASLESSAALDLQASAWDFATYLPGDLLPKADRAGLRGGVEIFAPYLDPAVRAAAHALPPGERRRGPRGKLPIRRLLAERLPGLARSTKKRGFGVPLAEWIRQGDYGKFIEATLLAHPGPLDQCLIPGSLAHALRAVRSGDHRAAPFLHAAVVLHALGEARSRALLPDS
jgi:asparagine synthase (glutamine-hydrolysing)